MLGTVQGDLHDIGKNLIGMMLEGAGFRVVDLGSNVTPERFNSWCRFEGIFESPIAPRSWSPTSDVTVSFQRSAADSKSDASSAVEGVFDAVTKALSGGDEVRLVGFGTFSVAKRKASTGRNPRTGEPMTIKASNQPKFKAGKGLKDSVN